MTLSVLFWVLYIVSLVFGGWAYWPASGGNMRPLGGTLLIFILIGILGWQVFGAAIHR